MKAKRLKTGAWSRTGLAVLTALCTLSSHKQTPAQALSATPVPVERQAVGNLVVRELVDPNNGDRWLLMRDPGNSAGPGRMVLAARGGAPEKVKPADVSSLASRQLNFATQLPVIHCGERLIVEENTPLVIARLEAVALEPALPGSPLNVRLAIGGKVLRALALGPGRAVLLTESEARP